MSRLFQMPTYWFALLFIVFATGCSKSFSDPDEFETYLNSEDYPNQQTQIKNGVKITVRYQPTEAMMLLQYKSYLEDKVSVLADTTQTDSMKTATISSLFEEFEKTGAIYSKSVYFLVTMGYEDSKRDLEYEPMQKGFNVYSDWMQKLVFGMKEYVHLETALIPEIPVDVYQMDRTYGLTKDRKLLFVFTDTFNGKKILDPENDTIY